MIQGVLKLMHIVPNDYTLESQFDIYACKCNSYNNKFYYNNAIDQ